MRNLEKYKLLSNIGNLIDLTVFDDAGIFCHETMTLGTITNRCSALSRLCAASMYYHYVLESPSKLDNEFIRFMQEIYHFVLDDTAHLVKTHGDNIQQIRCDWVDAYGFPKCVVSECTKTTRHYERERGDRESENPDISEDDALHSFYEAQFDLVHHFIFHLYDVGMRVDAASVRLDGGSVIQQTIESPGVTMDVQFARERDAIRSRRKECKQDLTHFESANNKFTIPIAFRSGNVTERDALCLKLEDHRQVNLERICLFLEHNHYDTDCIEMDLEDSADSNLFPLIEDSSFARLILLFIKTNKCMKSIFFARMGCLY